MTQRPRAALTGATGFLGLHLLPALLQAGFDVRLLSRRDAHPAWNNLPFETIRGSLADPGALAALVQNADVVVHAAGLIKALAREEFLRINQDGTAALAQITRAEAPAARFIQISSLAAREPQLSDYAFSKRAGENAANAAFAGHPEQLAIVRPPAIYGPWDRETLTIFRAAMRRIGLVPGRGHAAIIHARDAAGAIAALARNFRPGLFTLAGPHPEGYTMHELLRAIGLATGATPFLVPMPDAVVLAAARFTELTARLTGKALIFGPGKAREMLHPDWSVQPAEMLPPEIFASRLGLEEGLADTVAWYRQAGWL